MGLSRTWLGALSVSGVAASGLLAYSLYSTPVHTVERTECDKESVVTGDTVSKVVFTRTSDGGETRIGKDKKERTACSSFDQKAGGLSNIVLSQEKNPGQIQAEIAALIKAREDEWYKCRRDKECKSDVVEKYKSKYPNLPKMQVRS